MIRTDDEKRPGNSMRSALLDDKNGVLGTIVNSEISLELCFVFSSFLLFLDKSLLDTHFF